MVPTSAAAPRAHATRHERHAILARAGCPNADIPATQASTPAIRKAVVCLIDRERSARHLPVLHESSSLDSSAQGWSERMVSWGVFDHASGGSDPGSRISAAGFNWSSLGEDLAAGYATPRDAVRAWMASTGHCHNVLDPTFADVGTGVSRHSIRGFSSAPSAWTEDFGLAMGQSPPSGNYGPANGCPYRVGAVAG